MKIYYFYHHGCLHRSDFDEVEDSIRSKDYKKFCQLRDRFNPIGIKYGWGNEAFLPNTFFDADACKSVKITEENFSEIDECEWECG